MLDYVAWTDRAKQFVRGLADLPGAVALSDSIEAPGKDDPHEMQWLNSSACSLPQEIKQFVRLASQRCTFSYRWVPPTAWLDRIGSVIPGLSTIEGGADFCEANGYSLYDNRDRFKSFSKSHPGMELMFGSTGMFENRGDLLKLAPLPNKRQLAVELTSNSKAGCVVVAPTNGDGPRHKLSDSFDQFLIDWEQICYIEPRLENLRPWLDAETGMLRPDLEKARRLQAILREASA